METSVYCLFQRAIEKIAVERRKEEARADEKEQKHSSVEHIEASQVPAI